jgi:hypothetical protein
MPTAERALLLVEKRIGREASEAIEARSIPG